MEYGKMGNEERIHDEGSYIITEESKEVAENF